MKSKLHKLIVFISKKVLHLFIIQVLSLQFILANNADGQKLNEVYLSIEVDNVTLVDLFKVIEGQTDFKFGFDRKIERIKTLESFHYKNSSLEYILKELSEKHNLSFRRINENISVNKASKENSKIIYELSKIINGKIIDVETSEPLVGASVQVKGTTIGTVTDIEGSFNLSIPDDAETIIVSYIGFSTIEILIGNQTTFSIAMNPDISSLNEVVVIGYGNLEKRNVTTAIGQLKGKEIKDSPFAGFDQGLAGKLPGVRVSQSTGAPGSSMQIRIRGTNSVSAGNDPLYVIDGMPISNSLKFSTGSIGRTDGGDYNDIPINPLNSISVNDIESIEVLKDASAAAIYGSRGSNGVILITTKKGSKAKSIISFDMYAGVQEVSKKLEMLDAYGYSDFNRDGHNGAYLTTVSTGNSNDTNEERRQKAEDLGLNFNDGWLIPPEIEAYLKGEPGLTNTDWQDEIFRVAPISKYMLSARGGTDQVKYYVSGSYFDQKGIVISSGIKQYSGRLNLDISPNKRFRFGINLNPSFNDHDKVNAEGPQWDEGVIATALVVGPIWPVFNPDGTYNFGHNNWGYRQTPIGNPVAYANEIKDDLRHYRLLSTIYGEANLFEDFSYRISLGTDINNFHRDFYRPSFLPIRGQELPSEPTGIFRSNESLNWLFEQTLTYNKTIEKHNISGIVGFTSQKERSKSSNIRSDLFPNDLVQTLNAGVVTEASTFEQEWSLLSFLARVQYNYLGKYYLSGAVRSDGSSRFGKNNKWGTFPSLSLGWLVSEEPFFESLRLINRLKLRASYGLTGNFEIPNYASYGLIGSSNYTLGPGQGSIVNGLSPITASNPELSWETTETIDFGLETAFFDEKVSLEMDYYISNTSDLLLEVPVPSSSGFTSNFQNIGEVQNKGLELNISYRDNFGDLAFEIGGNFSRNINKVIALGSNNEDIIVIGGTGRTRFLTRVNEPIGSYYTLIQDGVLISDEEAENLPGFPNSQAGDFKFRDINGDGEISVANDATITGNYQPDFAYGMYIKLGYKGFDFNMNAYGIEGNEIFNLFSRYHYNMEGNFNNLKEVENRWHSEAIPGDGNTNRANRFATGGNFEMSTWHIEDGSFFRIQNITIGYTFPKKTFGSLLSNARIYLNTLNPITITNYSGYNPEVNSRPDDALSSGEDYGTYPLARTYTVGINLTF